MRRMSSFVWLLAVLLCVNEPAQAAHFYLGGLGGYSQPSKGDSAFSYGANLGFFVGMRPMVGLGVHALTVNRSNDGGIGNRLTSYAGEALVMPGMFTFGFRLGQMNSGLGNHSLIGGLIGYDFNLANHFTLGFQGAYQTILASTRFSVFDGLASLKFWF